jgi:hypothetical protein
LILDQNIVGKDKGLFAAQLGEAHQHIIAGVLLRLGFAVAAAPVRAGAYDLIITAYKDRANSPEEEVLVRTQCRTVKDSLKFTGGVRGGADREYIKPSPKEYKYTERHNDLIIGIDVTNLDFFLVPTCFIHVWGKSVSKNQLQELKNNFEILLNWRDDFLDKLLRKIKSQ